jgi:hypothetical protein
VVPSEDYSHEGGLGARLFREGRQTEYAQQIRKKKHMKTTSQKKNSELVSRSAQLISYTAPQAPRKHDAEIIAARQQAAWVDFEAGIYANDLLRARISHCLDRFGLGTSSAMVDEALDFLVHKDLGAAAQYFNQTGKAIFNRLQVSNAVLTFMSRKEQQRHLTDLAINEDDADHSDDLPGTVRASHLADSDNISPDEYAARRDALRTITVMVADKNPELYDLLLALGESGTRARIESYASRHRLALSSVYQRIRKLAASIQSHPLFAEFAAPFNISHQPA